MIRKFPIFEISPEAPESEEAMGTKEKFWFYHQELGLCLYKKASARRQKASGQRAEGKMLMAKALRSFLTA